MENKVPMATKSKNWTKSNKLNTLGFGFICNMGLLQFNLLCLCSCKWLGMRLILHFYQFSRLLIDDLHFRFIVFVPFFLWAICASENIFNGLFATNSLSYSNLEHFKKIQYYFYYSSISKYEFSKKLIHKSLSPTLIFS